MKNSKYRSMTAAASNSLVESMDDGRFSKRFLSRCRPSPTGCIEWVGPINPRGYGTFQLFKDLTMRTMFAHRVAWVRRFGVIPDGLQLDHLCRNRKCVNTDHLEAVDSRTNTLRGSGPAGLNARKTACHKGHLFTDANTYIDKKGRRNCRNCDSAKGYRRRRTAGIEERGPRGHYNI